MLKSILSIGQLLEPKENSATLKMVSHERMAGSVPVWEKNATDVQDAKSGIEQRFAEALNATENNHETSPFRMALASSETAVSQSAGQTPFGFGDILDIVNPLHHIPVVGSLYRSFSGDAIRGPGRVIGGALFGGPLGAAASMINMLVEYDTGRDLTNHALGLAKGKQQDSVKTASVNPPIEAKSTANLNKAILAYQKPEQNNPDTPYISTMRL